MDFTFNEDQQALRDSVSRFLMVEAAPENVRNFLNLAATGMFDTTTFSRIVKDFVIQGGNLSTGQKWNLETAKRAARKVPDEPSYVKHVRGIVSMARPDEPNSATTHFFILLSEAAWAGCLRPSPNSQAALGWHSTRTQLWSFKEANVKWLVVDPYLYSTPVRQNLRTLRILDAKTLGSWDSAFMCCPKAAILT